MSTLKVTNIESPSGGGVNAKITDINGGQLSNRNLIINGSMQIAQRGTSSTGVSDTIVYRTVDRFIFAANGAGPAFTESQSTTAPDGFANSLKIDCTTADTSLDADAYINVTQRFEGFNCQGLKKGTADAQSVTASFWVRSSKTGTYSAELFDTDNTRQITTTYTISAADTWEYKTITFPGDTSGSLGNDNGNSLSITWWLAAGTDFTSGTYTDKTWAANTNANRISTSQVNFADNTSNEWYITGAQLEVGGVATAFEHRSYGDELARCKRYFELLTNDVAGTLLSRKFYGPGYFESTTEGVAYISFAEKRAAPTTTASGTSHFCMFHTGSSVALTGLTFAQASPTDVRADTTCSSAPYTDGDSCFLTSISSSTTATFSLDSEL